MKRSIVCAAWIGMALAGNAAASESGPYVSASLGRAEMRNKSGLGSGPSVVDEDKDDSSWTLNLGYRINRHLALDLGYVDLGKAEADLSTPALITGRRSFAAEGATIALVGMVPIGRWEPYVKAGMLFSKTDSRFDGQFFGNSISFQSHEHTEDPFYGAGLRTRLTKPLQIYLDVTYFDKVGGNMTGPASYLNTSAGVLWQF